MTCWICDSDEICYIDILDCNWCPTCFENIYLERPAPTK